MTSLFAATSLNRMEGCTLAKIANTPNRGLMNLRAARPALFATHDLAHRPQIQRKRMAFALWPFNPLQPITRPAAQRLKCLAIEQLCLLNFIKSGLRLSNRPSKLDGFLR